LSNHLFSPLPALQELLESNLIFDPASFIRTIKGKKILIITSCSKEKIKARKAKAIDLYSGQLFRSVRKLAFKLNADLAIISAKYGFLRSSQVIETYDRSIQDLDRTEKEKLHVAISRDLTRLMQEIQYDLVVVILGKAYKELLRDFDTNIKFFFIFSPLGIGGYKQLVNKMIEAA